MKIINPTDHKLQFVGSKNSSLYMVALDTPNHKQLIVFTALVFADKKTIILNP